MKNIFLGMIVVLFSIPSHAQFIALGNMLSYYYNDVWDQFDEYQVQSGGEFYQDELYLVLISKPLMMEYTIALNTKQRQELLGAIQKYKEWRQIAIENQVEHAKVIQTMPLYMMKQSGFTDNQALNPSVILKFISNSPQEHLFVFDFPELTTDNEYLNIEVEAIFLTYDSVNSLENLLQEEFLIEQFKAGVDAELSVDDLFQ